MSFYKAQIYVPSPERSYSNLLSELPIRVYVNLLELSQYSFNRSNKFLLETFNFEILQKFPQKEKILNIANVILSKLMVPISVSMSECQKSTDQITLEKSKENPE